MPNHASPDEERARLAKASELTREAMRLTDGFAPTAFEHLRLATAVLDVMKRPAGSA
ncbi:hypothetical protein ACFOMD_01820 [Sphingoaurantiacus capsulatus]|uniref:Uncharacterized protein n=1 Tax=Sphingoaurantiacus capsulatus TaxID=1771310 RepID=A0ABV7X5B1_9SPHN